MWPPGWPARTSMLVVTSVTGRSKPCSIRWLTSITRYLQALWQLSLSVALSVRQPASDHGAGARHRLSRACHAPDQEVMAYPQGSPHGRGHPHPALWLGARSEYPLSHAVPRWGVRRPSRWGCPVSLGQGAHH